MKKRMKLTEKELAIAMWLYIKLCIKFHEDKDTTITMPKYVYLKKHMSQAISIYTNLCILCHKYRKDCSKCPLDSCSVYHKTLWSTVTNCISDENNGTFESPFTLQERLEACDKIIEAIEKDIPDDYVVLPQWS